MDHSDIPSLDDLRAFEATARLGSVRRAADSLALTHGAVSRRITKLADDIGVKLFERSGRGSTAHTGRRDTQPHPWQVLRRVVRDGAKPACYQC
ncbi:helix-turn-helix domain-containing protein [Pseudomonas trivialis]|uniref:helix-turn-helix domain-containing protein n=1 Tax=Pseudomonas trivialis TaxID=200450 RepID=UPI003BB0595A